MSRTAVVAFGGNALVTDAAHDSITEQYETVRRTVPPLADMIEQDWRLVVSHGNGPQVGFILRRSELAEDEVDPVPVDYAVADTQGAIGYMFVKALGNELRRRGLDHPVAAVVTQSVVDRDDPAFKRPDKPVGSFLDEATARERAAALGWTITQDAGRGWRRVVASPRPKRILETPLIAALLDDGAVVVAAGGGGIPVALDDNGAAVGIEAVVDKDRASSLLATDLGADLLLIPTAVPRVAIRFGTAEQEWLDTLTVDQARAYIEAGEFGRGSMEPKVAAVADFVAARPGAAGVIGAADQIPAILAGTSGTRILNAPADSAPAGSVLLAVNGTLMRGLKDNPHMVAAKATFVREAATAPAYRLWSVNDNHPAMIHVPDDSGTALNVEVWAVPLEGLAGLLEDEPPGLAIGKVQLSDGTTVLGVLGESALVAGQREITEHGGWRAYIEAKGIGS